MGITVGVKIHKTRFPELGYGKIDNNLWRVFSMEGTPSPVGPYYRTKAELMDDFDNYAAFYGCAEQAQPPARAWGETRETVAPNDEVEFLSPYTGEVSVVSYRGEFNGKAMIWTGKTQYAVDYSAIRRVVNA